LDEYLDGEAKELITGCLHFQDTTEGYKEVRRLLAEEYETPYRISAAYYEKLMQWPIIKKDDAASLKKFSLLTIKCDLVMHNTKSLGVLDNISNLQSLPPW
jgi:hypothetical protein